MGCTDSCSCRAETRGWGWCVLEGPAAETDVFVLPKSLPEAGREPCWLRPSNSCYSKPLCCLFHLGGQDGIELFLPDRHCSCPRDRPCSWGGWVGVTSAIGHSQGASSHVPDAGTKDNLGGLCPELGCSWGWWFSLPRNLQLLQKEILGCAVGEGGGG